MKTMLLIAWREMSVMLRRPSFYVTTLLIPLLTGVVFLGAQLFNDDASDDAQLADLALSRPVGVVDQANVIQTIPGSVHQFIIPFDNEATAAAALRANAIGAYFVVAPDYLVTGNVQRISRQISFTSAGAADVRLIDALLRSNLVNDPALVQRLDAPLEIETELTDPARSTATDANGINVVAQSLAYLLGFAIVLGGGWLVQAVAEEKENRTIEIVLTSVQPWQVMTGKVLGLGAVSLLQLLAWVLLGRGLLGAGPRLSGLDGAQPGIGFWLWMIALFLLGFLLFGSIMAAIGAVGASARESGQMTAFLTLPLLLPLWFAAVIAEQPNGMLALALSLFPITAPVTIILRLSEGAVPAWQLALSVALLIAAVVGALAMAARLFRATTLLTGVKPTPRVLWRALRGT